MVNLNEAGQNHIQSFHNENPVRTTTLCFQFSLGMPRQALLLIEGALVPILSNNSLYDHARALYLYTRCSVAAVTPEGATKKKAGKHHIGHQGIDVSNNCSWRV